MRIALALAAFVYSGASVLAFSPDNIPYCSNGFDKPARIVLSNTKSMFLEEGEKSEIPFGEPKVTLTVGDRTEVYSYGDPIEEGILYFFNPDSGSYALTDDVSPNLAVAKIGETTVILFADRVFWPCEE